MAVAAGTASAAGPTSATKDAASGTCVGGGTVEQLVKLVPSANGTLDITIKPESANFQPAAYLRNGACDGVEAVCSASAALTVQAVKDAPLFLYVEAANPGAYAIETKLTPKDTGASACAAARPSVSLAANNAIGPKGDTTQGGANVTPPASCAAGASGKEIVFTFVPQVAGDLELAILTENAAFDGVLSVVADCAAPSTTLACVNAAGPGGTEETVMPVEANKTYYVIVDTLGAGGEFTLSANLATPE